MRLSSIEQQSPGLCGIIGCSGVISRPDITTEISPDRLKRIRADGEIQENLKQL